MGRLRRDQLTHRYNAIGRSVGVKKSLGVWRAKPIERWDLRFIYPSPALMRTPADKASRDRKKSLPGDDETGMEKIVCT